MGSLVEEILVMLLSAILLGLGIAYLSERVIPMLKQIYESVVKLLATG